MKCVVWGCEKFVEYIDECDRLAHENPEAYPYEYACGEHQWKLCCPWDYEPEQEAGENT